MKQHTPQLKKKRKGGGSGLVGGCNKTLNALKIVPSFTYTQYINQLHYHIRIIMHYSFTHLLVTRYSLLVTRYSSNIHHNQSVRFVIIRSNR